MSTARPENPVASPCIDVCQLDERQVCVGCGRTLREITDWSAASVARRREICAAALLRLRQAPGRPLQ
jgi:predicted Fe-S protein YdhL (DUF1289 family)